MIVVTGPLQITVYRVGLGSCWTHLWRSVSTGSTVLRRPLQTSNTDACHCVRTTLFSMTDSWCVCHVGGLAKHVMGQHKQTVRAASLISCYRTRISVFTTVEMGRAGGFRTQIWSAFSVRLRVWIALNCSLILQGISRAIPAISRARYSTLWRRLTSQPHSSGDMVARRVTQIVRCVMRITTSF